MMFLRDLWLGFRQRYARIPLADIVIYTRQLAAMVGAGLTLVRALDILARETTHRRLRTITQSLIHDLENGRTLASAMRQHPEAFSRMYINMISAGETAGLLDIVLARLATFLERNAVLSKKIKGAMLYPAIICLVATSAIVTLLVVVIPIFQAMFASANLTLPAPTLVVVSLSEWLKRYWWSIPLSAVVLTFVVSKYASTPSGQHRLARLSLRLPVIGGLLQKTVIARFSRTLATLLSSGVNILEGLEITASTAGNRAIEIAILSSRSSIAAGATITQPLRHAKLFPSMVVSMIAVGEETGDIPNMLTKIADFYDAEVDTAVTTLLAAIEPTLVTSLGVLIGGMVTAMYLPIFDMVNVAQ